MCIRDRAYDKYKTGFGNEGAQEVDLPTIFAESDILTLHIPLTSETPVSYTHLRAHETVLDLVCRLLLEKKKTKPSKTMYSLIIVYLRKVTTVPNQCDTRSSNTTT